MLIAITINLRQFIAYNKFWNQIAELYNPDGKSEIKIGKVDCSANGNLCQSQNITELLTLKFFAKEGDSFNQKPIFDYISNTIVKELKRYQEEEVLKADVQSGNVFANFIVDYCPHCKKLSPIWSQLQDFYKNNENVKIIQLNCQNTSRICDIYEADRYPTLLWLKDGELIEKYQGKREYKDLQVYIDDMVSKHVPISMPLQAANTEFVGNGEVIDLDHENFLDGIATNLTFVKFFMTKCKYCKEINAIWPDVAKKFASIKNLKIAQVDCGINRNYHLCMTESKGSPTLNFYDNGKIRVKDYHEDDSLAGLFDLVESNVAGGQGKGVG